jgi:hypothetical protein
MNTDLIGSPDTFAIEYNLLDHPRPFGHVRLWLSSLWVGDLDRSDFLDYMCRKLFFLRSNLISRTELSFLASPTRIELERLVDLGNWSFCESFFEFNLLYYGVIQERQFHIHWQMADSLRLLHPEYPAGPQSEAIPFELFDRVTTEFLAKIFHSTTGWDELTPYL